MEVPVKKSVQEWFLIAVQFAAGGLLVLSPAIGAGLAGLTALLNRKVLSPGPLMGIIGPLLMAAVLSLVHSFDVSITAQVLVAVVAAATLVPVKKHWMVLGILTGLLLAATAGFLVREASRTLWVLDDDTGGTAQLRSAVSAIDGTSSGWTRNGIRHLEQPWLIAGTVGDLELSMEIRGQSDSPGWQWLTNDNSAQQEISSGPDEYTRIIGANRYLAKRVLLDESSSETTLRVSFEIRSGGPVSAADCGAALHAPWLVEKVCVPVTTGPEWNSVIVSERLPALDGPTGLEFRMEPLDALLDIRNFQVERLLDTGWSTVHEVEPTGVTIRAQTPGFSNLQRPAVSLTPAMDWESVTLTIPSSQLNDRGTLSILLLTERTTRLEVRNTELSASAGSSQPVPIARGRSRLWHLHPNLAGHSFAVNGLLSTVLTTTSVGGLIGLLTALLAVFFTGSRTAVMAVLAGATLLLVKLRPAVTWLLLGAALVVVGILAWSGETQFLGRLAIWNAGEINQVTRGEVAATSLEIIGTNPWTGVGPDGFADAWRQLSTSGATAPLHAHNFVLAWGTKYGVVGLVAALWLAISLVIASWRWGRWKGLLLTLPVLLLNTFDYTLFYDGVFYPLILGLNTLRASSVRSRLEINRIGSD